MNDNLTAKTADIFDLSGKRLTAFGAQVMGMDWGGVEKSRRRKTDVEEYLKRRFGYEPR